MNEVRYTVIHDNEEGQRLDNYLLRILKGVPKSCVYRMIRGGEVRVNKKRAQVSQRLLTGDSIRIPPVRMGKSAEVSVSQSLEACLKKAIVFEDNGLLVINKPSGLAVHGGSGLSLGLVEALRAFRHDLHYIELVHRLDKETSGCLLLAKKRSTLRALQQLLLNREVKKIYWALLSGPWTGASKQWVDEPLLKNIVQSGERMVCVDMQGKPSQTVFQLRENYAAGCLVEAYPKTGRTHQIRVHSAFLKHPIIGDTKYGDVSSTTPSIQGKMRLCLHAYAIEFTLNGVFHRYEAPPDAAFYAIMAQLREGESK